jgi:hypothetical protein
MKYFSKLNENIWLAFKMYSMLNNYIWNQTSLGIAIQKRLFYEFINTIKTKDWSAYRHSVATRTNFKDSRTCLCVYVDKLGRPTWLVIPYRLLSHSASPRWHSSLGFWVLSSTPMETGSRMLIHIRPFGVPCHFFIFNCSNRYAEIV